MLTSTSMDIWQWFKFESIYEQLYTDIIEISSKKGVVPGLKMSTGSKMALGLGLAFAQIFLLICPFIFFGKYSSQKNKVELAGINIDLLTGNTKNALYSGLTAWSIRDMGSTLASSRYGALQIELPSDECLRRCQRHHAELHPNHQFLREIEHRVQDQHRRIGYCAQGSGYCPIERRCQASSQAFVLVHVHTAGRVFFDIRVAANKPAVTVRRQDRRLSILRWSSLSARSSRSSKSIVPSGTSGPETQTETQTH